MKRDVKAGLRNKTVDELNKLLAIKRQEQILLRSQVKGNAKLSGHPNRIRKEIAIIQTIINEKVNKVHLRTK